MTKLEFIGSLVCKLKGLPPDEIEERLNFYKEIIEDGMEDGLGEEEAVAAIGSVEEVAKQIISEIPLAKIAKEKIKPKRRLKTWEIVLLIIGSPLWVSVLLVLFAVILSVFLVLWALVICLWAVFGAVAAYSVFGVCVGAVKAMEGNLISGLLVAATGLISAGLAVFLYFACIAATKGAAKLTKKMLLGIKRNFVKKEAAK